MWLGDAGPSKSSYMNWLNTIGLSAVKSMGYTFKFTVSLWTLIFVCFGKNAISTKNFVFNNYALLICSITVLTLFYIKTLHLHSSLVFSIEFFWIINVNVFLILKDFVVIKSINLMLELILKKHLMIMKWDTLLLWINFL